MNSDTNTATTTSNQKTSSSKPKVTASASDAATNTTYATTTRAKSSTRATGTSTHTISVGPPSNPHQYEPHEVDAIPGDTILFKFMSKNHSVTQAEAGAPCVPPSQGEFFFSGNFLDEVKLDSSGRLEADPPTWSLRVNNTKATYFYCTAIDSCNVNGMVGVINPPNNQSWSAQYHKAMEMPYQLSPGESPPVEGSSSGSSSSDSSGSSKGSHLSGGAIAGIVVGVVAFVAILVLLFFVLGRNRVYRQWMSSQDGRTERTAHWALWGGGGGGSAGTPSGGHNRKSETDPRVAQMDDTPSTATHMYSPETVQVGGMHSPYVNNPGSPPSQHLSSQSGWDWGQPLQGQQTQQPPIRAQEPFELDSSANR